MIFFLYTIEHTNILITLCLQKLFDCKIGLSDHTILVGITLANVALGAKVSENNFTLHRADRNIDSLFPMNPTEIAQQVFGKTVNQDVQRGTGLSWPLLG